jgi:hypothetical protein
MNGFVDSITPPPIDGQETTEEHPATDAHKLPQDGPSRNDLFDNSEPLALTHQDLNLSKRRHGGR